MNIVESVLKLLKLDTLVSSLTGYVEARFELLKAEVREDVSKAIAKSLTIVAMLLIGFMLLVFFSIGLAYFFNQYFEDTYAGFWIVAGIYGFIFLLLLVFRKSINEYFEQQFAEMMKRKEK
ncbi:MAG TPA: phage holin family protein [Cyclobacteriaceae bacterium]|nr:phage holin family protein [Cyclobacteriaceae bacterium]